MSNSFSFNNNVETGNLDSYDYKYRYPHNLGKKFKPGNDFHNKLVAMLLAYTEDSVSVMSERYKEWDAINNTLTVFIPAAEEERIKKSIVSSPLIVPVSYSNLQILLTYMMSFFMNSPVFKYDGVGGDTHDKVGSMLLEFLVHLQTKKMKFGLNFHTFFRDSYAFGVGVMVPTWFTKARIVRREKAILKKGFFGSYESTEVNKEERIIYEGNKLYNIDPYMFFPDPNVSASNIQDSEAYSYLERTNYMSLMREEDKNNPDSIFNVQYLKHINGSSKYYYEGSGTKRKKGDGSLNQSTTFRPFDVMHYFIDLIPAEIGLGSNNNVETWLFSLAGDQIIIDARSVEFEHGLKPIVVGSPDFDGYSTSPTSRLEMMYPLQDTMDWLFTSHIANVKKALNDMLVVDPKMVFLQDLMNPKPGRLIRLKKAAWGSDVTKAIHQLRVTDVTGSHMKDTGVIAEMLKQVSAAGDMVSGNVKRTGERVSATEAGNAFDTSVGRIQKDAMVFAMQAFEDLGTILASNTIQFMSNSYKYRLTGDWERIYLEAHKDETEAIANIDTGSIDVNFDVTVNDSSKLMSNGSVDTLSQLYGQLISSPEMAMQFDMSKILLRIAEMSGIKNAHEFLKAKTDTVQMPTADVEEQAKKGNIVPIEEMLNAAK